jgi:SulP family sulfate permease
LTVLLFLPFADVLGSLPRAILGAIVISAVIKLVRFGPLLGMLRYSRPEAFVAWTTFVSTLALSPRVDHAVLLGIGCAVFVHLWRELRVHVRTHFERWSRKVCCSSHLHLD